MTVAPSRLQDTIINRADAFLRISKPSNPFAALHVWHGKTRFAKRIPLMVLWDILQTRPEGEYHWCGGLHGAWQAGKTQFP